MRLPQPVAEALDATGLPWQIVDGKKHKRVLLDGRQVLVVSHGSKAWGNWRNTKNAVCNIRRAAQEMTR